MALGFSALNPSLKNAMASANSQLGQLRENYFIQDELYANANAAEQAEMAGINEDNNIINKNLLDVQEGKAGLTNPLNKMYDNVKQFVITNQGMCGMGMGMGKFSQNVSFSGAALIATSTLIADQGGAINSDWTGIAKKLNDAGLTAQKVSVEIKDENGKVVSSASREGIEITNTDGSKTTVCDANGNGGLDKGDYDFSDALKSFQTDLTNYTAAIKGLEDKAMANINPAKADRDTHYKNLKGMGQAMEKIDEKMKAIDNDIAKVQTNIADLTTLSDVANQTETQLANQATTPVAGSKAATQTPATQTQTQTPDWQNALKTGGKISIVFDACADETDEYTGQNSDYMGTLKAGTTYSVSYNPETNDFTTAGFNEGLNSNTDGTQFKYNNADLSKNDISMWGRVYKLQSDGNGGITVLDTFNGNKVVGHGTIS